MREILFRGKQFFFNDWIEGTGIFNDGINTWLSFNDPEKAIAYGLNLKRVHAETIGQFTGLTDKNGKKIFEGDIVERAGKKCVVKWSEEDAKFIIIGAMTRLDFSLCFAEHLEVIGNIHDNP